MWKVICSRVVKEHIKINRYAIMDLFKDLDRTMQKCFENDKISSDGFFRVYLDDQSVLLFHFFEWYTTLKYISGKNTSVIVSESNYHNKNYTRLLFLEKALKENSIGIGLKIPDGFIRMIKDVNPGELITFSNNASFACFSNENSLLLLKKCVSHPDNLFFDYDNAEIIKLNTDDNKDIYDFYSNLLKNGFVTGSNSISLSTRPQEIINEITGNLSAGDIKKVQIGPFKIRVSRSDTKKEIKWYDDLGNQISLMSVKTMIAWLNTAPITIEFIRSKKDDNNAVLSIYDAKIQKLVESLYSEGRYADIYNVLITYCKKNGKDLTINLKTYEASNKDFKATGISFSYRDGDVHAYKLQYENNNINNDILSFSHASMKDFVSLCENKKEAHKTFLKEQIKEQFIESKTFTKDAQELDAIAEILAKNDIESGRDVDMLGEYKKETPLLVKSYDEDSEKIKIFNEKAKEKTSELKDKSKKTPENKSEKQQPYKMSGEQRQYLDRQNELRYGIDQGFVGMDEDVIQHFETQGFDVDASGTEYNDYKFESWEDRIQNAIDEAKKSHKDYEGIDRKSDKTKDEIEDDERIRG